MNVVLRISDDLASRLAADGLDIERQALEAFVLEQCRAGRMTSREVGDALGFTVLNEIDGFLKAHGVYEDITIEDVEMDIAALAKFLDGRK